MTLPIFNVEQFEMTTYVSHIEETKPMVLIRTAQTSEMIEKCSTLVPEIQLTDKYKTRISDKSVFNFIAEIDHQIAGFMIGYDDGGCFYNYLFGVVPRFRNQGVGQHLFDHVEQWAHTNHYKGIRVQSRNKYPNMLRLLIKNKYKITAYIDRGHIDSSPIRFEKWWDGS